MVTLRSVKILMKIYQKGLFLAKYFVFKSCNHLELSEMYISYCCLCKYQKVRWPEIFSRKVTVLCNFKNIYQVILEFSWPLSSYNGNIENTWNTSKRHEMTLWLPWIVFCIGKWNIITSVELLCIVLVVEFFLMFQSQVLYSCIWPSNQIMSK